jgi:putative two-component system hydrogenase maturation factor HypX/HoxX
MSEIAKTQLADIVLAPFLTKSVPDDVYSNPSVPCIIVHPGIEGDRGRHSLDWALKQQQSEWGVTLLQAAEEMDAGLCLNLLFNCVYQVIYYIIS